jgi:heptose-I-phosphate ethanolaminephosphotransferase
MKQCGRDHGPLCANKLKYQYEVPFMIWCSETYKEKYPEQVENIKNAVNRPFLSDNICNMLFNVANIETPYYRDSLDLISPNYKSKKRVLNHKYVYEDIRYTIP